MRRPSGTADARGLASGETEKGTRPRRAETRAVARPRGMGRAYDLATDSSREGRGA